MRANSPGALMASLALHGAVVGLVLSMTYWLANRKIETPVIFELVAGPPDDPRSTAAPPAGGSDVKLTVPKVKTPPKQEVVPEEADEAEPETPTKPDPKQAAKPVPKKEPAKTMSYDQFVKKHGQPKASTPSNSAPRTARSPRVDTDSITRGVKGGTGTRGGGGTAMTKPDQGLMDNYISQLLNALRLAHEKPPGLSDQLEVQVTFDISASGMITNARISRSSGDPDFDRSVLEAFRRVGSIGPTPNGRPDTWTVRFRTRDE